MMQRWPKSKEDEFRAHLGRFEISGNDAIKPMKFSSGGQKSRVAFACLTFAKPHVLLMDEPTNHLDMNAIEALINALKEFNGGVMVISHDQHFITSVCTELWVVGGQKVMQFRGSFNDYKSLAVRRALKRMNSKKGGKGVANA
jgi:ATP-binding cassette subfamily F protein 3